MNEVQERELARQCEGLSHLCTPLCMSGTIVPRGGRIIITYRARDLERVVELAVSPGFTPEMHRSPKPFIEQELPTLRANLAPFFSIWRFTSPVILRMSECIEVSLRNENRSTDAALEWHVLGHRLF